MLTTRLVYMFGVATVWVMNGWALMSFAGIVDHAQMLVPGALVLDMIVFPVAVFAAYKSGEAAEEVYRRKEQARLAAAGAAAAAREPHRAGG